MSPGAERGGRTRESIGAPRPRRLAAALCFSLLLLGCLSLDSMGQEAVEERVLEDASPSGAPPPREGLLRGFRDALLPDTPAEAFEAARRIGDADQALARVRDVAEDRSDPEIQARAYLWLGQYHYGIEAYREASEFFEAARNLAASPETRAQVRFWIRQCRNLLELEPLPLDDPDLASSTSDVLALLAEGDSDLRRGNPAQALRRYLAAQGAAERLRCLAPVYYRVALVLSASAELGGGLGLDWRTVRSWEPRISRSAERALVASWDATDRLDGELTPEGAAPGLSPADSAAAAEERAAAAALEALSGEDGPGSGATRRSVDRTTSPAAAAGEARVDAAPYFVVQLGAHHEPDRARSELERLVERGLSVRMERGEDARGREIYRLRLGREATKEAAEELAERLCRGLDYNVVKVDPASAGDGR